MERKMKKENLWLEAAAKNVHSILSVGNTTPQLFLFNFNLTRDWKRRDKRDKMKPGRGIR